MFRTWIGIVSFASLTFAVPVRAASAATSAATGAVADKAAAAAASDSKDAGAPLFGALAQITIHVHDYDQALRFYTEKLGFEKREDRAYGNGRRWLVVSPPGSSDVGIVLSQVSENPMHRYDDRPGREALWVFHTSDCRKTCATLAERGVQFLEPAHDVPWGTQAVVLDLYGNELVLVQPKTRPNTQ